jgi:N-acyl-D-amino-acid deacylase
MTILDCAGCVVAPGFVDMHSHTDFTLPILPTADSLVHQGITTVVTGQCGLSPVPLLPDTREEVIEMQRRDDRPLPWDAWSTFGSYLDHLQELGLSINMVPLVGHGMVRSAVMGFTASKPSDAQLSKMQAEVEKAMNNGAAGISTGLIYAPGSYSSQEELVALARVAAGRGGYYFSHIRGEGHTLLEAVTEAIDIGRETRAPVQISHFKAIGRGNWDLSAKALDLIDRARSEGLDVTADLYPYLASSTSLGATLPHWAKEGNKESIVKRLEDAGLRRKMDTEMQSAGYTHDLSWAQVVVSRSPRNRAYEGHSVDDLAAREGKSPVDWVFDALLETGLDISVMKFGMSEENRRAELRHSAMMIGTDGSALTMDGPLAKGLPHPRSYGTFPRILGHHVREQHVLSLEEAVWKMTGLPARKLRWADRGLIKPGFWADMVILNPDTIRDQATYREPHQYPVGIRHVMVNGNLVIQEGQHTMARPGMILTR